jgi:hypothetical protein
MPIQSKDAGEKILLQSWKRQRAIEHMKQRGKFTEVTEATDLGEQQCFITMEPPKHGDLIQKTRKPRFRTKAQTQSHGSEQQPYPLREVINVEKIPSLDTTPRSPTLVVEETQQTTPTGMEINRPEEEKDRQNEDVGSQVQP